MTVQSTPRHLVPEDKIIVVLDTAPARNLAYLNTPPAWVETYEQMASDGYSFSLSEVAVAELIAQRQRGALSADDCRKICEGLERFLNPELPVLLGNYDLGGMLNINEIPWSAGECQSLSQLAWMMLNACAHPDDEQDTPEPVLQEERDEWIAFFEGWQGILDIHNAEDPSTPLDLDAMTPQMLELIAQSQDKHCVLEPPRSVRLHLEARYRWRQFVRKQQRKGGYDPESKKKKNDGIDANLFLYLILPAFVVTEDNLFFGGLEGIDSFQASWFFKPQALADAWAGGTRPAPTWPA